MNSYRLSLGLKVWWLIITICYYDTVIKNRNEKFVTDEFENIEKGYIKYDNFIVPNQDVGIKP